MLETIQGYEPEDLLSEATIIQKLIKNQLDSINTCFIAKITEIKENKVSVIDINKFVVGEEQKDKPIIIDCLVALPQSKNFTFSIPLQKDDVGICLVLQEDYSNYKKNGSITNQPNTPRRFDISDSIFIPFSLFNTLEIKEDTASIEIKDNFEIKIEKEMKLECSEKLEIKTKELKIETESEIEIKNSKGSLMDVCDTLIQMMDLVASGLKGSASEPSAYNGGKNALKEKIKGILK